MKIDKEKLIHRLKQIGIITLWVVMLSGFLVSLAFVNKEENDTTCSKIVVSIKPQNELLFVDREMVIKTIRADGNEKLILHKKLSQLNIPRLEKKLIDNKMIRSAEVFTDMNGVLTVHVQQREPILRVLRPDGTGFYIDRNGLKMPLSERFSAHVPVATGNIFESYSGNDTLLSFVGHELFKIATYVDKDAFWKAQIEQIFVTTESELVLIPKVGDHEIIFGSTADMEEKFEKLLLFYKEGLSRMGWDKYKSINLSYKGQVVCVKREGK
jgi:cell division protein FtsQ